MSDQDHWHHSLLIPQPLPFSSSEYQVLLSASLFFISKVKCSLCVAEANIVAMSLSPAFLGPAEAVVPSCFLAETSAHQISHGRPYLSYLTQTSSGQWTVIRWHGLLPQLKLLRAGVSPSLSSPAMVPLGTKGQEYGVYKIEIRSPCHLYFTWERTELLLC